MQDILIKIEDMPTVDEFKKIHNNHNIMVIGHNWLDDKDTYYNHFECIAERGGNIHYKQLNNIFSIIGVNKRDKMIFWVDFTDR